MYIGDIQDPRSEEEKAQDYHHEELGSGTTSFEWKEKPQSEWKKYAFRDQDGSFSCGGQAGAKALETILKNILSAQPIYRSRSNYASGGMWMQDLGRIGKNVGTNLETLSPSQRVGDSELNKNITVPTPYKAGGYVFAYAKNIDTIAEIVAKHKHCILLFHGNYKEYQKDIPEFNGEAVDIGHFICAVDYALLNGKKVLVCEDSSFSSSFGEGIKIITEEYLSKRFDGAMYFLPTVAPPDNKPHYTFTKALEYGSKGSEVTELQKVLRYEGFLPVEPTGNFFNITANSLKKWQIKHGIMDFANENNLKKIRFGNKSIKLANTLYS